MGEILFKSLSHQEISIFLSNPVAPRGPGSSRVTDPPPPSPVVKRFGRRQRHLHRIVLRPLHPTALFKVTHSTVWSSLRLSLRPFESRRQDGGRGRWQKCEYQRCQNCSTWKARGGWRPKILRHNEAPGPEEPQTKAVLASLSEPELRCGSLLAGRPDCRSQRKISAVTAVDLNFIAPNLALFVLRSISHRRNSSQRESRFIPRQLEPPWEPIIIIINYRDPHCIINDHNDNWHRYQLLSDGSFQSLVVYFPHETLRSGTDHRLDRRFRFPCVPCCSLTSQAWQGRSGLSRRPVACQDWQDWRRCVLGPTSFGRGDTSFRLQPCVSPSSRIAHPA
ncbi:uncharacterized protein [Equus przewalskii]|uniref:Uncharacterized protein n=1 Tax=Equus przewalskii TaxID=9798 RepID=A0ABM4L2H4_EQUPR